MTVYRIEKMLLVIENALELFPCQRENDTETSPSFMPIRDANNVSSRLPWLRLDDAAYVATHAKKIVFSGGPVFLLGFGLWRPDCQVSSHSGEMLVTHPVSNPRGDSYIYHNVKIIVNYSKYASHFSYWNRAGLTLTSSFTSVASCVFL